jgi:catechol 2,3-dioxygenase-like lactoylglutathione lyase family enzyme
VLDPVPLVVTVTTTAAGFETTLRFYDAALGVLGLVRLDELVDEEEDEPVVEAAAWGRPGGTSLLWVVTGPAPTTGLHLRLQAESRQQVETFHRVGVGAGGGTHAAPRRWPIYRRGEFNAILRDPQGNLIEAAGPE